MNKKAVSIILALIMAILFCSCGGNDDSALSFGDTEIGRDIYTYYLDNELMNNPDLSKEDAIEKANDDCIEYVKINSKYNELSITLSAAKKNQIANNVDDTWSMYGTYYKKIGISKSTLTKVYESAAYKKVVLEAIYGADGTDPIDETEIKTYYSENYLFFKAINGYYTDSMTSAERQTLLDSFKKLKNSITTSNTIDNVNYAYITGQGGSTSAELSLSVITKATKNKYPDGFFESVYEMSVGDVSVLSYDDYVFVVEKESSDKQYDNYYDDCLEAAAATSFAKLSDSWYSDVKVTKDNSIQKDCYKLITESRTK